jgi:predicted transcriptional regulator
MATTPYSFRLDDDLRHALETEARNENRTAAQLVTQAIRSMIDAKKTKRVAIEAALAQADKGDFVSQGAINDWMDSWDSDAELPVPRPDIIANQK